MLELDMVRRLPKVALHEHLDGSLRPQTMIELAAEIAYKLPEDNAEKLGKWFYEAAYSGSLERYLTVFEHTVSLTQSAANLRRVAGEFVIDQALDGVIYVETRWAPQQHLRNGLTMEEAIKAVWEGLKEGMVQAKSLGYEIEARQLLVVMRHDVPTTKVAKLADQMRDCGVVGFDIAGAEYGFRPNLHQESFTALRQALVPITIHAGEADGVDSIADALSQGALRIGHGVRLVEDIDAEKMGRVAQWVVDRQIVLEVCPTSNVQTGICVDVASHPVKTLIDWGCAVSISCDNRLLSQKTLSEELFGLHQEFGYGIEQLRRFSENGARGAFLPLKQRKKLLERIAQG